MSALAKGRRIIVRAEKALRKLLAETAANGEYDAVETLTEWARALSGCSGAKQPTKTRMPDSISAPGVTKAQTQRKDTRGYPQFYRHSNFLVKIGWSKASKSEYEHRAPITVARQLAAALVRAARTSPLIPMESVLPVTDADGEEVPSYQSYVCLAWFKSLGLVRQHGRKGYSLEPGRELSQRVDDAWENLQQQVRP